MHGLETILRGALVDRGDNVELMFSPVRVDIVHIGGWKGNMEVLRDFLYESCGLVIEEKFEHGFRRLSRSNKYEDLLLLPLGFERYRLLSRVGEVPSALLSLPIESGVCVPQSHSFCLLRVGGSLVGEFLRLLLTVDFGGFGDGCVMTSSYHHVGVTVHGDGGDYIFHLPSGVAESLCESILAVAGQFSFGIEV